MSGSSSWNTSAFAFSPNTNTMDAESMPSDKAQAAREKANEIMLALQDGKPGAADKMMGARDPKGNVGIIPMDWLKTKFSGSKKDKKDKKEADAVVRIQQLPPLNNSQVSPNSKHTQPATTQIAQNSHLHIMSFHSTSRSYAPSQCYAPSQSYRASGSHGVSRSHAPSHSHLSGTTSGSYSYGTSVAASSGTQMSRSTSTRAGQSHRTRDTSSSTRTVVPSRYSNIPESRMRSHVSSSRASGSRTSNSRASNQLGSDWTPPRSSRVGTMPAITEESAGGASRSGTRRASHSPSNMALVPSSGGGGPGLSRSASMASGATVRGSSSRATEQVVHVPTSRPAPYGWTLHTPQGEQIRVGGGSRGQGNGDIHIHFHGGRPVDLIIID